MSRTRNNPVADDLLRPLLHTGVWFYAAVFALGSIVLTGLATWAYWMAFGLTSVALVLALSLLSVPVVNLIAPIVVGRDLEQVTAQVWLGSGLIVGGSLSLIFFH